MNESTCAPPSFSLFFYLNFVCGKRKLVEEEEEEEEERKGFEVNKGQTRERRVLSFNDFYLLLFLSLLYH